MFSATVAGGGFRKVKGGPKEHGIKITVKVREDDKDDDKKGEEGVKITVMPKPEDTEMK